jgi:nitric oxide reductase NorE protein
MRHLPRSENWKRRPGVKSSAARGLPGEQGVWVFILIDMSFFCVIFASFVHERAGAADVFFRSQLSLDVELGLINTVLLLTSSWLVALATHAAPGKPRRKIRSILGFAVLCGAAFAAIKIAEYTILIRAGISPLTNDFFMFYFFISCIHLVHVLAGMVVLAVVVGKRGGEVLLVSERSSLDSAATYWHMVDLIWVMIFPMLYLVSWR